MKNHILQSSLQDALTAAVKLDGFQDFAAYLYPMKQLIWDALVKLKQGGPAAGWGQFKVRLGDAVKVSVKPVNDLIPLGMKGLREKTEPFLVEVFRQLT
ncbi:MAG: hypothetical protein MUF01_10580 [Bryobacterales bacterium]|nr:hypothetical protein [Bryobacterales bacterium]